MVAIPLAFYLMKTILTYLCIFFITLCNAQELLRNPSFESNCFCNIQFPISTTKYNCTEWDIYNNPVSPDSGYPGSFYMNTCKQFLDSCNTSFSAPQNSFGSEIPNTGAAYIGIYTFNKIPIPAPNLNMFITQKLNNQLYFEAKYNVSIYISLADNYNYSNNSLQVLFSDKMPFFQYNVSQNYPINIEDYHPQLDFQSLGFKLNLKNGWQQIKGAYVANGSEDRMTIGNFKFSYNSDTIYNGSGKDSSYCGYTWNGSFYFIDDVSLTLGIDAGKDTVVCANDTNTINLKASAGWQHYTWSNATGATVGNTRAININTPGTYIVTGTVDSLPNYSKIDTVVVAAYSIPQALTNAHAPNDTTVCTQTPVILNVVNPSNQITYYWQNNNSTAPSIIANDSGTYNLKINSGTCYKTDSVTVSYYSNQQSLIDSNTIHINNLHHTITANSGFTNYEWRDENNELIATTQSTSYTPVIAANAAISIFISAINAEGCLIKDTLQVIYSELPVNYPTIIHKGKEKLVFKNLPDGATVSIYNSLGQNIPYTLQSSAWAEGVYYYVVRYEGVEVVRKLVVLE